MADLLEPPRLGCTITDETTAEELAETIGLLCEEAERFSRRGRIGTMSSAYAEQHARIDVLLAEWEAKRGRPA